MPQAFFRPRSGGIVTLYIDAHVEPNTTPTVRLPGGSTFSQSSLWADLYSAIREAKHIIYIAGACLCAMPRGRVGIPWGHPCGSVLHEARRTK